MTDPVGPALSTDPAPAVRLTLAGGEQYSLHVFNLGLACCAVEFLAAAAALGDRLPVEASPQAAAVMVVSGTVTDKLAPAVRRLYDRLPEPRYVVSFGACSNTGGPYWDSYSVTKGVDQIVPVDVWVPGCPPRPEALLQGLSLLQERVAGAPTTRLPAAPLELRGRLGP